MKKLSYTDLNDEYKVLLLNINKIAGSVTVQKESALCKDHGQYRLLPPIQEASFNLSDIDLLTKVVLHHHGNLQVLMLHKYSSAAVINGEIYGSLTSRQKSSSLIIAMVNKQLVPCFIKMIFKISVVDSASTSPAIIQNLVYISLSFKTCRTLKEKLFWSPYTNLAILS